MWRGGGRREQKDEVQGEAREVGTRARNKRKREREEVGLEEHNRQ